MIALVDVLEAQAAIAVKGERLHAVGECDFVQRRLCLCGGDLIANAVGLGVAQQTFLHQTIYQSIVGVRGCGIRRRPIY
jgi:hypothetical protein